MSSSIFPSFFKGREKPLDLLPLDSDDSSTEECAKPSESEILSVDFFEDILDENNDQLSDIDGKIQTLETVLRRVVFNKNEIDTRVIEQEKHIRGLNSKLKNCKGKSKKEIQRRKSYLAQIELEKNLLDGFKKQSVELKALKSQMESKMSSFKDEKISIEKELI